MENESGKNSNSGNYLNVRNYLSGYATFTGYGPVIRALLGKKGSFRAEYLRPNEILEDFNAKYADIATKVFQVDPKKRTPMDCIALSLGNLRKHTYDGKTILQLDEFFARCYQEKLKHTKKSEMTPEFICKRLEEIENIQSRMTQNDNPQKRAQLTHNVIFNEIKEKLSGLLQQQTVQYPSKDIFEMAAERKITSSDVTTIEREIIKSKERQNQPNKNNDRSTH